MSSLLNPLPELRSRSEVVAGAIREAILSQRMGPGDTLVERRIAEDLGVSKTPVREALITLQQSGLVTVSPNRRLAVTSLTPDDVVQIYEQRLVLEEWALRNANIDAETIGRAEAALDDAQAAHQEGKVIEEVLANRAFHRALYETCANPYVVRSLDELQDMTALAITTVLWKEVPGDAGLEHEQHRSILEAAVRQDLDEASRLLKEHIRQSVVGKVNAELRG